MQKFVWYYWSVFDYADLKHHSVLQVMPVMQVMQVMQVLQCYKSNRGIVYCFFYVFNMTD